MADESDRVRQAADGSLWLPVAQDSPIVGAIAEVQVLRERRRWMAAPEFSRERYVAKPMTRRVGWLRALLIVLRESLRPRDEAAERLNDIENLILAGHNDAADRQIGLFRADYPGESALECVLGLMSLNSYDRGNESEARFVHEFALMCGTAHPAMIEVFGTEVPDHWRD